MGSQNHARINSRNKPIDILNNVTLKFQINHNPYFSQSIEFPLVHLFFVILRIGRSHRTPEVSDIMQVY